MMSGSFLLVGRLPLVCVVGDAASEPDNKKILLLRPFFIDRIDFLC